jgi:hypothetical protein
VDDDALRSRAQALYALRPDEFTAARTDAAAAARAEGDRELANAVKGLRRPAVAAWAVNLLARQRAELVAQVVDLGEALRQAQSLLQGDELRDLTRQRRRLVAAVTQEARRLAEAEGQRLSDAATRQVEETLQAAMADRSAAAAVASGLLAQPLSSTGLDSLAEVLGVPLGKGGRAEQRSASADSESSEERPRLSVVRDDEQDRREAQERVDAAGQAVRAATKKRDDVTRKRTKAEAKLLQLEAELEEQRRKVAEAEAATEAAAEKLTGLDAKLEKAEAGLGEARAEAQSAAEALRQLGKAPSASPSTP